MKKISNIEYDIQHLSKNEFIRERINPKPGDEAYLHLSDLLIALQPIAATIKGVLLDFGCGGSPYQPLFDGVQYKRADVLADPGLDYVITDQGKINARDESFDTILSTQVLEHVEDSNAYLSEAYRLLKPGGRLILSTHGAFFDHGCPYDFRRWTADGLTLDMKKVGFETESVYKLTTERRGLLFLAENYLGHLWGSRLSRIGLGLWMFQKLFWADRAARHKWIDRAFPQSRVVKGNALDHLYICTLVVAVKK